MTCREWIEIILAISSFICALVSIIIVIVTIRQNNKMLEESTRPVIAIYSRQMHNGNMPIGYLVVRNYGQSAATINKFDYDFDFSKAYKPEYATVHNKEFYETDWLKRFEGDVIAPGQSEICFMDFSQVNKPVTFNVEYISGSGKKYIEKYTVNLSAGSMLKANYNPGDEKKALSSISILMQEMLKQNL